MTHPPGAGAFGQTLDIRVAPERPDGSCEVSCDATGAHVNTNGIVHGGLLMTLLDVAMGAAVMRTLGPDERTASVTINTDFLRATKPGRLIARGRIERRARTLAFPAGEVIDGNGDVIARATGLWAISRK